MPIDQYEAIAALIEFRSDILKVLTNLTLELKSLRTALDTHEILSATNLDACREKERNLSEQMFLLYDKEIAHAHALIPRRVAKNLLEPSF